MKRKSINLATLMNQEEEKKITNIIQSALYFG